MLNIKLTILLINDTTCGTIFPMYVSALLANCSILFEKLATKLLMSTESKSYFTVMSLTIFWNCSIYVLQLFTNLAMLFASSGITKASKATIIRMNIKYDKIIEIGLAGLLFFLKTNLTRSFCIGTISIFRINAMKIPIQNGISILPINANLPEMLPAFNTANSTRPAKAIIRQYFFIL